jgi:hypothetical protein
LIEAGGFEEGVQRRDVDRGLRVLRYRIGRRQQGELLQILDRVGVAGGVRRLGQVAGRGQEGGRLRADALGRGRLRVGDAAPPAEELLEQPASATATLTLRMARAGRVGAK